MAFFVEVSRLPKEGAHFELELGEEAFLCEAGTPATQSPRVMGTRASLYLHKEGSRVVHLVGQLSVVYTGFCRRCLSPIGDTLDLTIQRTFRPHISPSLAFRERESWDETFLKEWIEEEEYEGEVLDLEEWLREEVLLALPEHPLCREDCLGLCPICGENRNEVRCGCQQKGSLPPNPFLTP